MRTLLLLLALPVLCSGCYYDNEEELYGPSCDTTVYTYSGVIQPIIAANCSAPDCHGPNGANGELITYDQLRAVVDDGTFRQAVIVERRMPDNGSLTTCELALIENWLDAGAPNN